MYADLEMVNYFFSRNMIYKMEDRKKKVVLYTRTINMAHHKKRKREVIRIACHKVIGRRKCQIKQFSRMMYMVCIFSRYTFLRKVDKF